MPDPDPTRQGTPPERAALHLADAAELLGRHLTVWPPTFRPRELAALLAGGRREKAAYRRWQRRIDLAIYRGQLIAEPAAALRKPAAALRKPPAGEGWLPEAIARAKDSVALRECSEVTRDAAARWLQAIGEEPPAVVLAWIGAKWRPPAEKPRQVIPDWIPIARAFAQQWMRDRERETGVRPNKDEIAKATAAELRGRQVKSRLGNPLTVESIRRHALTGITGRPRGHNLRRMG